MDLALSSRNNVILLWLLSSHNICHMGIHRSFVACFAAHTVTAFMRALSHQSQSYLVVDRSSPSLSSLGKAEAQRLDELFTCIWVISIRRCPHHQRHFLPCLGEESGGSSLFPLSSFLFPLVLTAAAIAPPAGVLGSQEVSFRFAGLP